MKKIVVFSGTTEGRKLAFELANLGADVTVCVATESGREEQGEHPNITVLSGRKTEPEMADTLAGAALCIDATHPYAVEVTRNVARAAEQAYVPYVRLVRERGKIPQDAIVVDDADEAAKVCKTLSGNILLTTGTKELEPFLALPLCRLYPRVLPSSKNIATLEQAGIPHRNIIAMEGPFSLELNVAIIRQFHIEILVTKDGGTVGGFPEKAEAAKTTGTELIVLRSPEEKGSTYREVLNICREMMT